MKKLHYSLIEIMVAMGVFALMMTLLMQFFGQAQTVLSQESARAKNLYEGGVLTYILTEDVKNMVVDDDVAVNKSWSYLLTEDVAIDGENGDSSDGVADVILRFHSTITDVDGTEGVPVAISLVYSPTTHTLYRYVVTTVDPGGADAGKYFFEDGDGTALYEDWDDFEGNEDFGSVILEGLEDFSMLIYGDYTNMTDTDLGTSNDGISSDDVDSATALPDAIQFSMVLNDPKVLGVAGAPENLLVNARRALKTQVMIAY